MLMLMLVFGIASPFFLQESIQDFKPSPQDLDYPAVLERHYSKARDKRREGGAAADSAAVSMYDTWYPTLRQTLLCLSKIYRCVEVWLCPSMELPHCRRSCTSHTLLTLLLVMLADDGW